MRFLLAICLVILLGSSTLASPIYEDAGYQQDLRLAGMVYSDHFPLADWSSLPFSSADPIIELLSSTWVTDAFYVVQGSSDITVWKVSFSSLSNATIVDMVEASASLYEFFDVSMAFFPPSVRASLQAGVRLAIVEQDDSSLDVFSVVSPSGGVQLCACPRDSHGINGLCSAVVEASFPVGMYGANPYEVFDTAQDEANNLLIGTDVGLFQYRNATQDIVWISTITDAPILTVAVLPASVGIEPAQPARAFAGSEGRLWYSSTAEADGTFVFTDYNFYWVGGLIDGVITSLDVDRKSNALWVGNDICVNVLHQNRTWQRIAGPAGLAVTNVTNVHYDAHSQSMWVGSWWGASRYRHTELTPPISSSEFYDTVLTNRWDYYSSARWLPAPSNDEGRNVTHITSLTLSGAPAGVIATDYGIGVILTKNVTLSDKADYMQSTIYPRHDMYGLTASCPLATYGDLSSWYSSSNDNDGLWTAMYLASQSFRYAVTKDPAAKAAAWRAFQGLGLLNRVTGIKGLPARSALKAKNPPDGTGGTWYNSTAMPGWIWKADTSSDEIVGHMMAYPIFRDLVCETPEEKNLAATLQLDMISYIIDNGFVLIDVTGQPTTWGIWSPNYINGNQTWFSERGLNSMQIVTWIVSAYRVSNYDPYYLDAYNELVGEYGYGENLINQKITDPADVNFSDDELAFLPYLLYFYSINNWSDSIPQLLHQEMNLSIVRAWNVINREHPALWNFIYSMDTFNDVSSAGSDPFKLKDTIQTLQEWPMSQISWPMDNLLRRDFLYQRMLTRSQTLQADRLISYAENDILALNNNPFEIGADGSGTSEAGSYAWLLPYWLGRYLGQISPPS